MSKKKLIIMVAAVTTICLIGAAGFWFWSEQDTKETKSNEMIVVEEIAETAETITIEEIPIFDVNTHLAQDKNTNALTKSQAAFTIVSPPPFQPAMPGLYDGDIFYAFVQSNLEDFGFASGGGSLNIMIQKYGNQTTISDEVKKEFETQAKKIATYDAMAFGEIAALHLALGPNHPFEEVAPDHPLFLLLSDLSAEFDLPILFHMEAVDGDMSLPAKLRSVTNNPDALKGNIEEFKILLDHNKEAKIIWLQAGWDHTGDRTTELMAELLNKHPNLYMGLKIGSDSLPETSPLNSDGKLKNDWQKFLTDYADRVVVASDNFFSATAKPSGESEQRYEKIKTALSQLPTEVAEKIAYKNAVEVFKSE